MFTFFRNQNPQAQPANQAAPAHRHEAEQTFNQVFGTPPVAIPTPATPTPPATMQEPRSDCPYTRERESHHSDPSPMHTPTPRMQMPSPIDAQIDFTRPFEFSDFMRRSS